MIAIRALSKRYPDQRPDRAALKSASLDVGANEIVAVIGPNAAGKSTLLDLLATVTAPTAGSIVVAGIDAAADPRRARAAIGYVPSGSRSLFGRLTARQNLRFFAALYGLCGRAADAAVEASLERWDAGAAADIRVDRLSDGMACRVALARAVLHGPAVLLLDEATRSIDPMSRPRVLRAVRDYVAAGDRCAVLVTHDLSDVRQICRRAALMRDGVIERVVPAGVLTAEAVPVPTAEEA